MGFPMVYDLPPYLPSPGVGKPKLTPRQDQKMTIWPCHSKYLENVELYNFGVRRAFVEEGMGFPTVYDLPWYHPSLGVGKAKLTPKRGKKPPPLI